jgi:hypothetical protein
VKEVCVKRAVMRRLSFAFVLLALFVTACAGDDNFRSANPQSKRTHKPDTWRVIAEGPIKSDYGHKGVWTGKEEFPVLVWTGKELIVWGGAKEPRGNTIVDPPPPLHNGAAYTPPK